MKYTRSAIAVALFVLFFAHAARATDWINPGVGNWFTPGNWNAGVPSASSVANVNRGTAQFATQASARFLFVGSTDPPLSVQGAVQGNGALTTTATFVGYGNSTGIGVSSTGAGVLTLSGGTLTSETLGVGYAAGTGTNCHWTANGTMTLNGAPLLSNNAFIGIAAGTGTNVRGTAVGKATVLNADITPLNVNAESTLGVGVSGGTGVFHGNATGTLDVTNGDIRIDAVQVGVTGHHSFGTAAATGTLTVTKGDINFKTLEVAIAAESADSVAGMLRLFGGTASGTTATLGTLGSIVLGIQGPNPGVDYGRITATTASLNGAIEARFTDGYSPPPGSLFNLVTASAITGNYTVNVTGINPAVRPFNIVRNGTLLQLRFLPEPSATDLAYLAGVPGILVVRRRHHQRVRD